MINCGTIAVIANGFDTMISVIANASQTKNEPTERAIIAGTADMT